ncbi:ABC transporter substrate-binding protein [Streptomyces montanisoli]|uniref:Extracellular solute-binding protein n=1 Tax=Streptomyces montanisoli TaxID=2798581 RepID=A0A940ME68_9ACTN|nr:extracellular solute-binding protein [Streptomyces montanisoli]MBP0459619.1 extracellular solute-binding protein [Streptomyces montanisoli]
MRSPGFRRTCTTAIAVSLALTAVAACSSSKDSGGTTADGKTALTINCMPPKSNKVDRTSFQNDIKTFEKANPKIDLTAHDTFPCEDPKTFDAKLAGGQMENVFYTYFTDVKHVVSINQAADITDYVKDMPGWNEIDPKLRAMYTVDGKVYGVPRTNYTMGLLYNPTLFKKAGLDPNKPPTTWAEVRADAKKIAALGHGTVGYADYSAQNQGGWHFVAELYSQGGQAVSADGKKATVDTPQGKAVLQNLHDMRWKDNSMGSKQLLIINDVQQMMGTGKLGMYVSAPDNIPTIAKQYGGDYKNMALGPMPGGQGTLAGGDGYMFNKKDTPAQIKAGLKFLTLETNTPGKGLSNWQYLSAQKSPVGLPEPRLWTQGSDYDKKNLALKKQYANVPVENYQAFADGNPNLTPRIEPPNAQQIYSVLDSTVSAVLTNKNADIDALLKGAQSKIDSVLAQQG